MIENGIARFDIAQKIDQRNLIALRTRERAKLKQQLIAVTHSQFAVPLLDQFFARPIFQSNSLRFSDPRPSRQAISSYLRKLREAGILKVIREGGGRRGQVLALAELVNLCEG